MLGNKEKALFALEQFAALGEADDRLRDGVDTEFAALHNDPRYRAVLARFVANELPSSKATLQMPLSRSGVVAEDIDFDKSTSTFLLTDMSGKKILRATMQGDVSIFGASPSNWPMFALKIDVARNRVWATEVALDDFSLTPKEAWGRSAILCFELTSGSLLKRIEAPFHGALGDMLLLPDGSPVVSDGANGAVYQLRAGSFIRLDHGDFISPQTPALMPNGVDLIVPDYVRGIGILSIRGGKVRWLNSDGRFPAALTGVDGLYRDGTSLFLTQNGTTPQRVMRIEVNPTFTSILRSEVIDRTTPLNDPTHGVIVGRDFYFIANSGWAQLDDHGILQKDAALTPVRVMHFNLH